MTAPLDRLAARLSELRRQFDESFTRPLAAKAAPAHNLLTIVAGDERFALRLSELGGIHPYSKVTPLPEAAPSLLGIVGIRGCLLSVHRLASFVGAGRGAQDARWLLLPRGEEQLALAVEGIDAYLHVADSAIYPLTTRSGAADEYCIGMFVDGAIARPLLSMPALIAGIYRDAKVPPTRKEPR